MKASLDCQKGSCDLGDVLEYTPPPYTRVKVRVTDWDTIVRLATNVENPTLSAGGLVLQLQYTKPGDPMGRPNCRINVKEE
jgi:hypothetical protein